MIAADTNIFIHALDVQSPRHQAAALFLQNQAQNRNFLICELVLIELYMALRNPAVFQSPLSAPAAVEVCKSFYNNRAWQYVDYDHAIRESLWDFAAKNGTAFRQIIDFRLALTLRFHGVREFATVNLKHFQNAGFDRVWNPLEA